jgi:hypothetical protein
MSNRFVTPRIINSAGSLDAHFGRDSLNDIHQWAIEKLLRAGAASRCAEHHTLVSKSNDQAVRQAVLIARLHPFATSTADVSELVVLEIYLGLEDDCPFCTADADNIAFPTTMG